MTDFVMLRLLAGDGGKGKVSFRREKHIPKGGPDGGEGARGGSVIFRAVTSLSTLKQYAGEVELAAQRGANGGPRQMSGKSGEDLVLEVPVGTEIWSVAENHIARQRRMRLGMNETFKRGDVRPIKYYLEEEGGHAEKRPEDVWIEPISGEVLEDQVLTQLTNSGLPNDLPEHLEDKKVLRATLREPGQEVVICQGGFGGRGNIAFKSSTNTTPLEAEHGTTGEKRVVALELKLLADVGFVGYPNAGKSTLLSVLTDAKPKVANYPFTTLEPHLGILRSQEGSNTTAKELVLADIPGLISGASEGKGLGFQFLRHVENSSQLLFVLALDEMVLFDEALTDIDRAQQLLQQYQSLLEELDAHHKQLLEKPRLVAINKVDLYSPELQNEIAQLFTAEDIEVLFISAATLQGVPELRQALIATEK